jgi:Tfp pilus assembly protein PilN
MQAVNLLPAYARPGSRWSTLGKDLSPSRVVAMGGALAAAAALGVGALYLHERSVVNDKRSELADTQARLAAAEALAAPLRAANSESDAREGVVRGVIGSRVAWDRAMGGLARVMPTETTLASMSIASGGTFQISGNAVSHVRVALVLDRLALLPWLSGVSLTSSVRASGVNAGDTFAITAAFTGSGATG